MNFDSLKDSARPIADLQDEGVQAHMKDCDVIYGLELKERRIVQFWRKDLEGAKKPSGAKSMAFTYNKAKMEYEVLLAAAAAALGEHVVMEEQRK